jgi:predicted Zn-dependent protease
MTGRRTLLAALPLALAAACAVNPATGKRQFVLMGEGQEIALGRESDKEIVAEMGVYEDPELERYVQDLGAKLAAKSERPDLEWSFRVMDAPLVNAFALPGGYIYITRGIIAHLQSEAELATVLGHEIGHVTARHSVSQMSKAQVAQIGLGVGSVLAPEYAQDFGSLAQMGLGLLFLKYGRDDERQADELGLRYLLRAGYDPRPAVGVFDTLGRVSASAGGERVPGWASTHPAPENRIEAMQARIAATGESFAGRPDGREEYERRLENIVFGDDPRQGFFEGDVFYHPEMEFRFEFPPGWKHANLRAAVVSASPEKDAAIQLSLAKEATVEEALRAFFSSEGVARRGEPMAPIHGLPTAGDGFTAATADGMLEGRVGFVEHGGRVLRLVGYAPQTAWVGHSKRIRAALASFDRVAERRVLDVEPRRLHLVRAEEATSLDEFAKRHGATVPVATLALINRLDDGERLRAGRTYKSVTGGPPAGS